MANTGGMLIPRLSAAARQACFASTSAKATQPGSLVRSRHRAALKGVEEARRMHKPEGWTSSLQKFLDAPYEGADSVATAALQQPEVDNSPQGSPSIAVPRKKGVKDGPWTARDDQAMVEALTENANRSKGSIKALLGKSSKELEALLLSLKQPKFRGQQIHSSLQNGSKSIADISNLPAQLRTELSEAGFTTGRSRIAQKVVSKDGTQKFLLQLHDGRLVETVGIPNDRDGRVTVCLSSQVGCPMRCTFCATGKGGFARNLMPHEIIDQLMTVQEHYKHRISNIVFMGMGEPLLTMRSVLAAVEFMINDMKISARRITISTVGVPNAIMKLASHKLQCTLAISIHAPTQALRERLVPSAKMYPLEALMMDCREYFQQTGRRVTLEYTLMAGVNDGLEQAEQLSKLLKRFKMMAHVNLIPYNPVEGSDYVRPSRNQVVRFSEALTKSGIVNSIRITKGLDAAAACGQLRNEHQKQPLPEFAGLA